MEIHPTLVLGKVIDSRMLGIKWLTLTLQKLLGPHGTKKDNIFAKHYAHHINGGGTLGFTKFLTGIPGPIASNFPYPLSH